MRARRLLLAAGPGLAVVLAAACGAVAGSTSGGGVGGSGVTGRPAVRFAVQPRGPLETWVRGTPTFPITDAMKERPGRRALYRFTPSGPAEEDARRVAQVLGVTGQAQAVSMTGVVDWSVSGESGGLRVGDWPARALSYEVTDRDRALRCFPSATATAPADRRCPDGSAPLTYDGDTAVRDAAALAARLAPGQPLEWRRGGAGGGITVVEGRFAPGGADGPLLWEVSFDSAGRVVGLLGLLGPLVSVGDYPTLSVAEAVARLDADWLPREPFAWGAPVVGCAPAPPVSTTAPDPARPATRPVAMPMTTAAPGGAYPLPLATAAHGYAALWDSRCTQFLAPVVLFTGPGGDRLPVLALTDDAIDHLR